MIARVINPTLLDLLRPNGIATCATIWWGPTGNLRSDSVTAVGATRTPENQGFP